MDELDLNKVFNLIADGKITELEAERLINAKARLNANVATSPSNQSNTNPLP